MAQTPDLRPGVVLQKSENILKSSVIAEEKERLQDEEDETEIAPVRILEEKAAFDDIVVWTHEATHDDDNDTFVRGVGDWIAFAEQVSCPVFVTGRRY